jgi:hypothetical protein
MIRAQYKYVYGTSFEAKILDVAAEALPCYFWNCPLLLCRVLSKKFCSSIGAPYQRAGSNIRKSHVLRFPSKPVEHFWRNISINWQVSEARLQVLSHRKDANSC